VNLDKVFRLSENHTNVRTEVIAGFTTFFTMAYIIFLQPAILSGQLFNQPTGLDFGAITTATCLAAALATAAGFANAWQVALGVVFFSGVIFLLVSISGIREKLINVISPSLKNGIAGGIGLFIAFIGLRNGQLVVADKGTLVGLNPQLNSPDLWIFLLALIFTAALYTRKVRGAILWGILFATLLALAVRYGTPFLPQAFSESKAVADSLVMTQFNFASGIFSLPPSLEPTFFKMDLKAALSLSMLPFIFIFFMMDLFDTMGTIIGVSEQAGFLKNNRLPRANRALLSDAIGTVAGAAMGTSTVTSFVESASGVEQGGRTGLTSVVVALLFILALFFSPIIRMVGSYPPLTAPALVLVGAMMMQNITKISWKDASEAIPAFLIIVGIPLTFSIADGLALGFIAYPVIKLLTGRGREVHGWMYPVALALLIYFFTLRSGIS